MVYNNVSSVINQQSLFQSTLRKAFRMYANLKLRLKKFYNDHNILDWDALWVWWKLTFFVGLVALACNSGCADKGDDPPNCQSTTGCTDVDGGSDVDADDATPDADIDGNSDACAAYAWLNGTVWDCPDATNICDMTAVYHADLQACLISCTGTFNDVATNVWISEDHQHLTDMTLGVNCWKNNL